MKRPSTGLRMTTAMVLSLGLATLLVAAGPTVVVSGQLLAYQDGFVFFTTGDGFRVAPSVVIRDAKTGGTTAVLPAPRIWARATFDATGTVTELDLSRAPLPPEGNFADVTRFAVAASSPAPNPDLLAYQNLATPAPGESIGPANVSYSGKPVLVTFIVQVPPTTPLVSSVYISTDQSAWSAQAIPMDRIDALHYEITRRYPSGTIFHYLYDRGSLQSEEIAQNGLSRKPRNFIVPDADVRSFATPFTAGKTKFREASISSSRRSCRRPTTPHRSQIFRPGSLPNRRPQKPPQAR